MAFAKTKKYPLYSFPEICLKLIVFRHLRILGGIRFFFFDCSIQSKHGVVCRGFLLDGKRLFLEQKHIFRESKMVRNKRQEDANDCKGGDSGLEGLN